MTQKWEPHAASSSVWVDADADEVEGRDCLGLPFIWTSGVAGEFLSGREVEETSETRGLAGEWPFTYCEEK